MLVLYAVVRGGSRPADRGDLQQVEGDSVAVIFEERDNRPSQDRAEVLAFAEALLALSQEAPMLPVRYGTVVDDRLELAGLVSEREETWSRRLDEVAGHVEMLVHVEPLPAPASTTGQTGRDFLMARVSKARHEDELLESLMLLVAETATEVRRLPSANELRVACLVRREAVDSFEQTTAGWGDTRPERTWCTGPWPPFSFAEAAAS